jgi:hypothetical protein
MTMSSLPLRCAAMASRFPSGAQLAEEVMNRKVS